MVEIINGPNGKEALSVVKTIVVSAASLIALGMLIGFAPSIGVKDAYLTFTKI